MKANQKFLNANDDAVSPVIAVILMVAITVVLAATVYVWVSGFGSQAGTPEKSMSFTSASTITTADCDGALAANQECKSYTVASATNGMKYSDVNFVVNGVVQTISAASCATNVPAATGQFQACAGQTLRTSSSLIKAGDLITFEETGASGTLSGQLLQVLDPGSNSVLYKLTIS